MTLQERKKAQLQFVTWVRNRFPELYNAAVARAEVQEMREGLSGLGQNDAPAPTFWQKLAGGLTTLGTTYLSLKNQRDAMKLNLARAEQGLPPVDAGVTAPVVRTEIDLPPDVVNKLTAGAGTQVNKLLLFAGAALIGVMLFMRK